MKYIVQKFGGTSVSTEENRLHCLSHIKEAISKGYKSVVVVSAMGRKGDPYSTDTLISLLNDKNNLSNKEMDLLLSTGEVISANIFSNFLNSNDISSIVLTGGQAGIITDNNHTNARIISLQPEKLLESLRTKDVVVVTGFQGVTPEGDVTTLGRGGSDTSATALGSAIEAEYVDIFTDVEGIMTADPRIVEDASILNIVSYNEICNLAHLGAKVIHPRAVEIAMQKNIPIRVRSTFSNSNGTLVTNVTELTNMDDFKEKTVTGITSTKDITQISVKDEKNSKFLHKKIFSLMENNNISIDFINVYPNGASFTVSNKDIEKASNFLKENNLNIKILSNCAKVSLVGGGIAGVPGIMSKIVSCLTDNDINILQSADSHTTIWVLVEEKDMNKSIISLHKEFNL